MRKLYQTAFGADGNCWSTCIACILDLDVADVPDFNQAPDWAAAANEWLGKRGLAFATRCGSSPPPGLDGALIIASGMSGRGVRHAVLWRDGAMVHDPHPSGDGLRSPPDEWDVLVVADLDLLRRPAELVDSAEIARLLKIQPSSVPTLVKREGLPHARVGRHYRFRVADVIAWAEERMVRPGAHQKRHGAVVRELRRR